MLADVAARETAEASPETLLARAGRAALCEGTDGIATIVLAATRSDREGYGRLDIETSDGPTAAIRTGALLLALLTSDAQLVVEPVGAEDKAVDLLENSVLAGFRRGAASDLPNLTADTEALLLDALRDLLEAPGAVVHLSPGEAKPDSTPGQVHAPDCTDYALSPASFVARRDVVVGDDGCEHLAPATLPLRQYPLYQLVVHGRDREVSDEESPSLPGIEGTPPHDSRLLWGHIYEFSQSWTSLGHSLGEVKYSLALAPGEAVKLAVIDWRRQDAGTRTGVTQAQDTLVHGQTVDRDIEDIVSGRVAEQQSGESFMAGLAGAMDFTIPKYGISAAGRHSVGFGMSATRGKRDMAA